MEKVKTLALVADQNAQISKVFEAERGRLLNFIRKRVAAAEDAEDVLQDVLSQFVESYRLMRPIEQVSSWLFTVARNRITDRFRKKKSIAFRDQFRTTSEEHEDFTIEDFLPGNSDSPETEYTKQVIMDEMEEALAELPEEQRQAFMWHEMEGESFKSMAERTGLTVNTWISRKRYAVAHLRNRLGAIYHEFIRE